MRQLLRIFAFSVTYREKFNRPVKHYEELRHELLFSKMIILNNVLLSDIHKNEADDDST